jgi:ribonucleotide monophosphatase NagD (HAD superfamily)
MPAALLDIDGVLTVSGVALPGAVEAVARLREDGHALRFVTNNTIRSRSGLARDLRELGFDLDAAELETAPLAAGRLLSVSPGEALMVGDDAETDVAAAVRLGMRGVLVRTGKFREETLARADRSRRL